MLPFSRSFSRNRKGSSGSKIIANGQGKQKTDLLPQYPETEVILVALECLGRER